MRGLIVRPDFARLDVCERAVALCHSPMAGRREIRDVGRLGPLLDRLRRECWHEVCRLTGTATATLWPDLSLVSVMPAGDAMPAHADNVRRLGPDAWGPNHTPWRRCTSLLYLAACEGGALHFPDMEVSISPRPGLFVAFPCGREYVHAVLPITNGPRYALSMWYTHAPEHRET